MYRAALIQNESEMVRHGWADIRPMLVGIEYDWVNFTGEHLNELLTDLSFNRFDGIIIASNACNDQTIMQTLQRPENRDRLSVFLDNGGGLFLSLQMRLSTGEPTGILPEKFDVRIFSRDENEPGHEGDLKIQTDHYDHIIFTHPYKITEQEIVDRCLHNEFVKSFYRAYLDPLQNTSYDTLLYDGKYIQMRPLLLSSRIDLPGRVVATTMPLDWQAHRNLLRNIVQYVITGHPHLAIVEKRGQQMADFQYLLANLEGKKVPFSRYVQDALNFGSIELNLHQTLILDPSWTYDDLVRSNFGNYVANFRKGTRLIYFGKTLTNDPIVSQVGGVTSLQGLLPSVVTWVRSRYANGRWEGSFWKTFDVISTFKALGISVEEYQDEILASTEKHNLNGSYDEVMGATCALLRIYEIYLGSKSAKFRQTLDWIRNKFSEAGFYEQASAIDAIKDVGEAVDEKVLITFRTQALIEMHSIDDELRLYRYAKTLFSSGFLEDALRLCERLEKYQSPNGVWLNIPRTATILILLIELQKQLTNPSQKLDEMIFKGVIYLKGAQNPITNNWNNDISATVKSLKAIISFEERVLYPIDEIVMNLDRYKKLAYELQAIDTAVTQNARLQTEKSELRIQVQEEYNLRHLSTRLAVIMSALAMSILALSIGMVLYAVQTDQFNTFADFLLSFLKDLSLAAATILTLAPLIMLYAILRSMKIVPSLIDADRIEEFLLERLSNNPSGKNKNE